MTAEKIGFIGLGRMGQSMAANLRKKQFPMMVYDIRPEPVAALEALGAETAGSAEQVVRACDIVVTMLPSDTEVEALALGAGGMQQHGRQGSLLMDMSTVDPATTDRIAAALQARSIAMVDAPVGRLASHADRGESLFMVGAADADFQRVKPLLEAMGTTIYHCGPVGAGMRTKLVNNFLAVASCQLNAEALALAQRLDLSLSTTLAVISGTSAVNGQLKLNWSDKVLRGDVRPGFTIDLAHKDLSLIMTAANRAKLPMPMGAAAREAFSAARAAGFGGDDFSAMLLALCRAAGIPAPKLSETE